MIEASAFIEAARRQGFGLYAGVPCSYLKPFINYVIDDSQLRYVGAANEGDAVAIAAGAELGGQRAVAMFQNSGLGNAVNPLTSLTWIFRLPVLVITTLRGEPGGPADEPQHELMGGITTRLLEQMDLPWEYFPTDAADVDAALERACAHMTAVQRPYALVMRKGSVAPVALQARPQVQARRGGAQPAVEALHRRAEMLRAVQAAVGPADIVIATTGYTGRELFACDDRANQLYMVGSMGCAVSLGLGLALARPDLRIIVLDGDGAALMRLGALSTVGFERPPNLLHVLLDNGIHESTGGQATVSRSVDFSAIAAACGYPRVAVVNTPEALHRRVQEAPRELEFIHVPIQPGIADDLPRPDVTPAAVAARLRAHLRDRHD
ncbi:MAG: phosphonopyruvate decarboxylase [Gammaproteobacteria bacterium]|nr:phosphonopyruvate decarboxylase [Gammaproteobacteria bacterium]